MKIIKTVAEMNRITKDLVLKGNDSISLVPTMGFLHAGHHSLIQKARIENEIVIVSIFVNPTQFGENEDLASYPSDIEGDIKGLEELKVDYLFLPNATDMYGDNYKTYINVNDLTNELCGISRPTHFRGVCSVVAKLFNITRPNRAYFGKKDAQQLAVIEKMVEDLNFDIQIVGCPIIREDDGLAKSSRNKYLTPQERQQAICLNRGLKKAQDIIASGSLTKDIIKVIADEIAKYPLAKVDYIKVVDRKTIQVLDKIDRDVIVAIAVYIGKARLIDNFYFNIN